MSDDLAVLPVRDGDCCGDADVPRVDSPGSEKDGEAHAGDAGPEGCADAGPEVVVESAEPVRVNVSRTPSAMMAVNVIENVLTEPTLICESCGLAVILQARSSTAEEFVNYHMVHADYEEDGSRKYASYMLIRCDVVNKQRIDERLRELPFKVAALAK